MPFFPTSFTPTSTTGIVDGQPNLASPVKNGIDGLATFVGGIDDQRALSEQTTNYTVVANRDIFNPINASGSNITVTMPAGSTHTTQPITFYKVGADFNTITLNFAGTDRVDLPWSSLSVPTSASLTMGVPGELISLYPILKSGVYYWRPTEYRCPHQILNASAYSNATQSAVASGTIIAFNTETRDPSDSWNNSSYRYTAKIAGEYLFVGSAHVQNIGSSTGIQMNARRFNVSNAQVEGFRQDYLVETTSNAASLTIQVKFTLAVGDYVNFTVSTLASTTLTIYGNSNATDGFTNISAIFLGRV